MLAPSLNNQTTEEPEQPQQPSQGQPNPSARTTQSATLDESEIPMCYSDDFPTTVTVNLINGPDSVQVYEIGGTQRLRVGADLTFSFTNANGESVDGIVTEQVIALEGDPVFQDSTPRPLVDGRVSDTVATPGIPVPTAPVSNADQLKIINNFNQPFVTKQLITITLTTNSGTVRVTQARTLTNRTPGAAPIAGGRIGGYTFTMEKPQITLLP